MNDRTRQTETRSPARGVGWLIAAAAVTGGLLSAGSPGLSELAGHGLFALHLLPPLLLAGWLATRSGGRHRVPALLMGLGSVLAALLPQWAWGQIPAGTGGTLHVVAGALTLALCWQGAHQVAAGLGPRLGTSLGLVAILLGPPAVLAAWDLRSEDDRVPPYSDVDCLRFLTATTDAQARVSAFPSAARPGAAAPGCGTAGCHAGIEAAHRSGPHAPSQGSLVYRRLLAGLEVRRGLGTSRWCRGCHQPHTLTGDGRSHDSGCGNCHLARPSALYGSAALAWPARTPIAATGWQARLRPSAHARLFSGSDMLRQAVQCAGCHRKHFGPVLNEVGWRPGQDEYRQWLLSPWGPGVMSRDVSGPAGCTGCHDPHSGRLRDDRPPLTLHLFLRRSRPGGGEDVSAYGDATAGSAPPRSLDLVVANTAIGHDFPTGMPDQRESWVEVLLREPITGRFYAAGRLSPDGRLPPQAHVYGLVPADRRRRPIVNGELDRMAVVLRSRRIEGGQADLVRFRWPVGLDPRASVTARVLQRAAPGFRRAHGLPAEPPREVARLEIRPASRGAAQEDPEAWLSYGRALAVAKYFPAALSALQVAGRGDAVGTELALGELFLQEGDLLQARERFWRARSLGSEPARTDAWEGSILRRMGRPEEAVRLLQPIAGAYPGDLRVRFELGRAYLDLLRHEEAVDEFRGMLELDPLDVSGHFNLMHAYQRLNRPTEARREETLYRLLVGGASAASAPDFRVYELDRLP